jgi:class 3 adenylate cyclase/sugar lactone lactonase YvrE
VPKAPTSALRAVLFTDVVGSTELARELGDLRWGRLLAAQRRVVREELKRAHGREVDTAGDGFFAVFESPADAVRCAFVSTRRVQDLGLDIRGGVHFGEVETSGTGVHGIVVHTGARVMGHAGAAEVLITQTVKDLVAGSRFNAVERGAFDLKGVPGTWTLYDVLSVDDDLRPQPIEGATVAQERRERASSAPPPRRSRRWIAPAAAAAALALAAGAFAVFRSQPTNVPTVGTAARVNADGVFDAPIAAASFPTAMAAGDGKVWVTDQQGQIYWIDTDTGEVGSRGAAGTPTGVAVGGGAVWMSNGFGVGNGPGGAVTRLDPATGDLVPVFDTPAGSEAIAWGADAVWVADHATGSVTRFDPVRQQTASFDLTSGSEEPPEPDAIAFSDVGRETVWVGDAAAGRVFRVDVADPEHPHTLTVGAPVSAIAAAADAVWVTSETADTVYVLDATSGAVRTSIDVGAGGCNAPSAIAVGSGGVWVACSLSHEVMKIDPETSTVAATLAVDGAPDAVATDEADSVWIAVRPQ